MPRILLVNSPEKFKFWDPQNNAGIDVSLITESSGMVYSLKCPDCGHCFRRSLHGLKGCKFCMNQDRCLDMSCEICFANSLASRIFPTLGAFLFYASVQKNPSVTSLIRAIALMRPSCAIPVKIDIRQIAKSDTKSQLTFMCRHCWHVFECRAARVESLKYCPFCSPVPKQLCPDSANCQKCFVRSFASHPKSEHWDFRDGKNQGKCPTEVFKSGTHCADLVCDECDHEFQMSCNSVTNGCWCPYCPGQKRCSDSACLTCTNKKLSSLPAAKYWNAELNGGVNPDDVSLTNGRTKWWFNCENSIHPPYQRDASHIRRGQLCSECSCSHKTERAVCDFLRDGYPYTREFAPAWCRNGRLNSFPRFDIRLGSCDVLIEIDGQQHFTPKWKFGCPEKRRKDDVYKMKRAAENGFSGIRLYQVDVYENRFDWKKWLQKAIAFVQTQSVPCWVFQSSPVFRSHIDDCRACGVVVIVLE